MSLLTLVRHGQASFFADDYDRLTSLGEQQALLLGEHWARQRLDFDEVYCGPRLRQKQTAEITGTAIRQAGRAWPAPVVVDDLDELDLDGLLHRLAPDLARQNTEFAGLVDRFRQNEGHDERVRDFQRLFEALLLHWQASATLDERIESWPAFRRRVERAIRQAIEREGGGRRVVYFTSGGFVGTAVQWALAAPDRLALELSWRVRNGSLTEFVFTRGRFTLDAFNAVPHLRDPALWTFR